MSKKQEVPFMLRVVRWWFPRLERYAPAVATRLFVQLFFTPLHYGFPEKEKEWLASARVKSLTAAGKKVMLYEWGEADKPIVIFVHGWAGRATQFRKFFPACLEAGFKVVAFDAPAHGKSEGKSTTMIEFADALSQVIQTVGTPQAVITHSFGGAVSFYCLAEGLQLPVLVNIGTPVVGDKILQTFLNAVNGNWATAESFKKYMVRTYGRTFDEFTVQHFVTKLSQPVRLMLVHDSKDRDVTFDQAERMAEIYPEAWLYRTDGLGHTRILKDETVIKDILKFIKL